MTSTSASAAAAGATRPMPGLTEAEAEQRRARGLGNDVPAPTSRSLADIFRANVLTRFNALLGTLLVVILLVGPLQDALFGLILIANTGIGVVQELRAKRTLDRLGLINAARARLVREGEVRERPASEVVEGDLLELVSGDQLVVDATLLFDDELEIDESLLTGEAEPVPKRPGDALLSGSFVAAGHGYCRASRVGESAYAARLAAEARRFTLVSSELRDGINRLLRVITWIMIPTAALLLWSQFSRATDVADAVRGSVAGVVTMVPEGLVLLTSIAFAVGVIRLGRRRVLVQELPAIEALARVDVIGIDKTGTLTTGELTVAAVEALGGPDPAPALGALAAADAHPNATLRAIAASYPPPGWVAERSVPFSSARRWSGTTFAGRGSWVLAAPEVVLAGRGPADAELRRRLEPHQRAGRRVLLLAGSPQPLAGPELPAELRPRAAVVLAETPRPEAAAMLRFFADEGVTVKVISGDHPATVSAIAGALGLAGAERAVDASELPEGEAELAEAVESACVIGRVDPHRKRAIIDALRSRGHVVAMTGDGVNDVLALKNADVGVAMGSGSPASRAVAQLVLLDNRFDAMPQVIAEGRRVIGNIERVANLFLTKTVYAMLLALAVGVARLPFPFLPRHLTLVSAFTIGLPGFVLALAPNTRRATHGFVAQVLRFCVPAGVVAAAGTFVAYAAARETPELSLGQARTTATLVLFGIALLVLARLGRPSSRTPGWLYLAMAAGFCAALAIPVSREFFALPLPPVPVIWAALGVVAVASLALELGRRVSERIGRGGPIGPGGPPGRPAAWRGRGKRS